MIEVQYIDNVYVKINGNEEEITSISKYFTFTIDNINMLRKVNPRLRYWDGKISLFKKRQKLLPYGLIWELYRFCKDRKYKLVLDDKIKNNKNNISKKEFKEFVDDLNLTLTPREYQLKSIFESINRKRITIESPTASGKSYIIAIFMNWCLKNTNKKILMIVPTIQLVRQFDLDWKNYGFNEPIHQIMAGIEKISSERIYVSTWQSMFKMEEKYFEQFETIILDECLRKGSKVKTNDGYKNIEDVKSGDIILSYNIDKKTNEYKEVLKNHKNLYKSNSYNEFLRIEMENGKIIECTPNHKIYTKNRGYVRADELTKNDDLITI